MKKNLPVSVEESKALIGISRELHKSNMFPNVKSPAGAFAVVQVGAELGLGPMTSLMNINIIKGKPTLSAQLMLAEMVRAGYEYVILEETAEVCSIRFSHPKKEEPYIAKFTIEEAKKMGLVRPSSAWTTTPSDMLFARAVSRGKRRYAPEIGLGFYTTEEVRDPDFPTPVTENSRQEEDDDIIEVNPETGEIIEKDVWDEMGPGKETEPEKEPDEAEPEPQEAETAEIPEQGNRLINGKEVITDNQRKALLARLHQAKIDEMLFKAWLESQGFMVGYGYFSWKGIRMSVGKRLLDDEGFDAALDMFKGWLLDTKIKCPQKDDAPVVLKTCEKICDNRKGCPAVEDFLNGFKKKDIPT